MVGYTDGSRMNGRVARATAEGDYGRWGQSVDSGAWEEGYRVVSDRQVATKRCLNQRSGVQRGGSWIHEGDLGGEGGRRVGAVVDVGNSGVVGNKWADKRTKDPGMRGLRMSQPGLATPAAIKHLTPKEWRRRPIEGRFKVASREQYLSSTIVSKDLLNPSGELHTPIFAKS